MTQADSAVHGALRRSLDSDPRTAGQGQAQSISAKTPLPTGWGSFCSTPDSNHPAHWYATAPYSVFDLKEEFGPDAEDLVQVVDAPTWAKLHQQVAAQINLYESLVWGQK
ncbi:hypothetical protein ACIGPN_06090 [Streptomyces afghaniensis]|uniref:hypothetical protein n=1 Tax=Streptomyces afghaniensis TaxID=66865 RepID=UPI0037D0C323